MENTIILLMLILLIWFTIFTVKNIRQNSFLKKKQKVNFEFLTLFLPLLGALIYYAFNKSITSKTDH